MVGAVGTDVENEKLLRRAGRGRAGGGRHDGRARHGHDRGILVAGPGGPGLSLHCVATSPRTAEAGQPVWAAGRAVRRSTTWTSPSTGPTRSAPEGGWSKAAAAAHTREKLVAVDGRSVRGDRRLDQAGGSACARRSRWSCSTFGLESTLSRLGSRPTRDDVPLSPDGGVIADFTGEVGDPAVLAARLEATPGVVEHGLFPPELVSTVFVGRGESVQRIDLRRTELRHGFFGSSVGGARVLVSAVGLRPRTGRPGWSSAGPGRGRRGSTGHRPGAGPAAALSSPLMSHRISSARAKAG